MVTKITKFYLVQQSVPKGRYSSTSRERLYNELGWEPLCLRRWSRRLILFYKFVNELTPDYTRDPIPSLNETTYPIRSRPVVGQIRARTEKFKASFYPHCLLEWNKLDPEIRTSPIVGIFKKKLCAQIRPPANSVYGIHDWLCRYIFGPLLAWFSERFQHTACAFEINGYL